MKTLPENGSDNRAQSFIQVLIKAQTMQKSTTNYLVSKSTAKLTKVEQHPTSDS